MHDSSCFIAPQNSGTSSSSLAKLNKELPAESMSRASPPRYDTIPITPPPSHAMGTSQKGKPGAVLLEIVVIDGILWAARHSVTWPDMIGVFGRARLRPSLISSRKSFSVRTFKGFVPRLVGVFSP
jgi:hypothetical protein